MSSPILGYQPGGGVGQPVPLPPLPGTGITNAGLTQLVIGQSYIDVVFDHYQVDNTWIFVECSVLNLTDGNPLNIWPGITTSKTQTGFRLQLNGLPDSNNYFLDWAISGINITPTPATTYFLTGPSSGPYGAAATFTVALPGSTTLASPVVITPNDGGVGGTFAPTTVTLTTGTPSVTFTYTPSTYGARTIAATNTGPLSNPAGIVFTSVASTYTLTGPSSGTVSVPSTNFTVALPAGGNVIGTVTVTPNDSSGGGTFTPTTVPLTTAAPSATFTYTPASAGAKTISVTNTGGLTNPGNLTYTSLSSGLNDGDSVSSWPDSSGNGHAATQTGSARPIFKTNIINGKPVVRFTSAALSGLNITSPISGNWPFVVFAVMKQAASGGTIAGVAGNGASYPNFERTSSLVAIGDRDGYHVGTDPDTSFHVLTGGASGSGSAFLRIDGTSLTIASSGSVPNSGNFATLGYDAATPTYSNGDIAEILLYSAAISAPDGANIEKYLGNKYGITVAGGSVIDPTTVSGLAGWWKADSLL